MRWFCLGCAAWLLIAGALAGADKARTETKMLSLHTRRQKPVEGSKKLQQFEVVEQSVEWDPKQTALIVCDMWDDHWCQGAARRVVELAGPLNRVVEEARRQGVFIIHAPSTTVDFYADAPQRQRAQAAPLAKTPVPLASEMRWGTCWCWPDKDREPDLPIDDSDMGCDCREKCEIRSPWTRQIASIDIDEADAISDNGQEVFNLLRQRGIKHVIMTGVHLNMCVLGRPFAIRQLVHLGFDVVLVRDMTDTMYNSQKKPFVDHFTGTDLVVEHVEKYWCPTIASVDLVGGAPFRFKEDKRPKGPTKTASKR